MLRKPRPRRRAVTRTSVPSRFLNASSIRRTSAVAIFCGGRGRGPFAGCRRRQGGRRFSPSPRFGVAHRPALRRRFSRQAKELRFLLYREQRARVALGELALLHQRLHLVGQLQETKEVRYRRPVSSHQPRDLRLGKLELFTQALITRGLINRVQIVALKIFDESERQQRLIVDISDDRRESWPTPDAESPASGARRQ